MPPYVNVTVLGSGGVMPTPERGTPAILVETWNGLTILLDAGEGVQSRLRLAGRSPESLDYVVLTHEHGDHVNGLAGLLQSMAVSKRRRKLTIIGPRPAIEFALDALEATGSRLGFPVDYIIVSGSGSLVLLEKGGDIVRLDWFPVCHTPHSLGYRVRVELRPRINMERLASLRLPPGPWIARLLRGERVEVEGRILEPGDLLSGGGSHTIVYTGDTAPCTTVLEASRGARVLLHDSTYDHSMEEEAIERRHSTSTHAAGIAAEAGVETLVLVHVSPRYRGVDARRLEQEARLLHPRTILSWDGMRLRVPLAPSQG